ncbi:MAG: DUF1292 domain-containing protein [Bacilli bacterium]|nr:DUF1292 domain-containing protein [Bacilli bacterium]
MDFQKDQIVTLDNNENYFVANTVDYNGTIYALLVNVNKDDDYMIVKRINENNEITIELVENDDELTTLSFLLQKNTN